MGRLALRSGLRHSVHAPGAVEAAPAWAASTKCVSHDGVDDYTYAEVPRTIIQSAFSVSLWFKLPSGMADSYIYSIGQGHIGDTLGGLYSMRVRHYASGSLRTYSSGRAGTSSYSVYTDFRDDTWHHYVYTGTASGWFDGTASIYIDGSLEGTTTSRAAFQTSDAFYVAGAAQYVASQPQAGGYPWPAVPTSFSNSKVDELTVWTSALSASDVTALYNSGTPDDPNNVGSGPAHYWRMGEAASGSTIPDQVGSSDSTLTNGATVVTDAP
mgnify:CR=1 FL=1